MVQDKKAPQENPRLGVPRAFLDAAVQSCREHVHNSCAEVVFDLNEIGTNEWEDRAPRKAVVPSATKGDLSRPPPEFKIHFDVVCISAAGELMISFFAPAQSNETARGRLKIDGFRLGVDLILNHHDKPYMNAQLFAEYIFVCCFFSY
jgi:hypothetical protein